MQNPRHLSYPDNVKIDHTKGMAGKPLLIDASIPKDAHSPIAVFSTSCQAFEPYQLIIPVFLCRTINIW
jgi:hypothetical protein